jgi:hypothetical protein
MGQHNSSLVMARLKWTSPQVDMNNEKQKLNEYRSKIADIYKIQLEDDKEPEAFLSKIQKWKKEKGDADPEFEKKFREIIIP